MMAKRHGGVSGAKGPSRRQVLRLLAACAAAPTLSSWLAGCGEALPGPTDLPSSERVLVIGAGAAGLGAARALADAGITVTVIEGTDRIGGRMFTETQTLSVPAELGASWIHGVRGNPISELAESIGAQTLPTDYDDEAMFDADGSALDDTTLDAAYARLDDLLREVRALARQQERAGEPDRPLGDAIEEVLAGWQLDTTQARHLALVINSEIEQEYAADVGQLSLYRWEDELALPGEDVVFAQGYVQIAEALAEGLDVRLGEVVTEIADTGSGVTVATQRGTFDGDRVIVTLPLGLLKGGSVRFSPALDAGHQQAVDALGMGLLDKLYLEFPRVFWAEQTWIGYAAEEAGAWAEDLNLHKVLGAPVLLLFNAGSFARSLTERSDAEVVDQAMARLRVQYGSDIPEPVAFLRTRWQADAFTGGSYSYLAAGSSLADRAALAAPLGERIFFAGEATHSEYPATVHGALLSGQREASRWAAVAGVAQAPPGRLPRWQRKRRC